MKKLLESINISNLNKSLYFLQKILKILYILLIIIVIYFLLNICKEWEIFKLIIELLSILSPLFLGLIISYILNPLINKMSLKIKRKYSVIIIYTVLVSIIVFLGYYIYPKFIRELNEFIKYLPDTISNINNFVNSLFHNNYKININKIINKYFTHDIIGKLSNILLTIKYIFKIISIILLGLMISFYFSLNFDEKIKESFDKIPIRNKEQIKKLLNEINTKLFSYIKGTFIISLIVFFSSFISFSIIKLKPSIFLALYNSISNIIPYIGPYIGALPILLYTFSISQKKGIISLIILIIIQLIESYILQPYIMSKSMKLHPVTILISLLIFGYFFGIIGMIMAMPIVSVIKTCFIYFYKKKSK